MDSYNEKGESAMEKTNFYWQVYKNLEREFLSLAEVIHIDDHQLENVYSMYIADLLMHTSVEIESLSKHLYMENGGQKTDPTKMYFDTDCIAHLNSLWNLESKVVLVVSPILYLEKDENLILTPLKDALYKQPQSAEWEKAYQAVKHDRAESLKTWGKLIYLLHSLAALYVLNIYNRNARFTNLSDLKGSNIDWGLGSKLFSVKVSPESEDKSIRKAYQKKPDYDECVYIIKHTDDTNQVLKDILETIDKETNEKGLVLLLKKVGIEKLDQFDTLKPEKKQILVDSVQETKNKVYRETLLQHSSEMRKAVNEMVIEAVLNKNQY